MVGVFLDACFFTVQFRCTSIFLGYPGMCFGVLAVYEPVYVCFGYVF